MKIVIDSNRVIAALLKDSTTREILFNSKFEFIAPEFLKAEIEKYEAFLIKKTKIRADEFDVLLSIIFERIRLISLKEYEKYIKKLKSEISDPKDIPFLACNLATKAEGIWTHDAHFLKQDKIKAYTNIDLLNLTGSK
ncbi:hypothetical protein ISS07_02805 [Candidatus Woesearchaeota archaeon]|nr:hypothetical protein [Candidatus Woesearchaeota archaeon]